MADLISVFVGQMGEFCKMIDESTVCEFIKAYYSNFATNSHSLEKFYSQTAYIQRPSFEGRIAKKISECKESLAAGIKKGSEFKVLQYTYSPLENSTNVVVSGEISYKEEVNAFTQFFTISEKENSIWIDADSLTIRDLKKDVREENEGLVDVRRKGSR